MRVLAYLGCLLAGLAIGIPVFGAKGGVAFGVAHRDGQRAVQVVGVDPARVILRLRIGVHRGLDLGPARQVGLGVVRLRRVLGDDLVLDRAFEKVKVFHCIDERISPAVVVLVDDLPGLYPLKSTGNF